MTKAVSERFISVAICCFSSSVMSSERRHTAAGLPAEVKCTFKSKVDRQQQIQQHAISRRPYRMAGLWTHLLCRSASSSAAWFSSSMPARFERNWKISNQVSNERATINCKNFPRRRWSCAVNSYQTSFAELNLPPKCYVGNDKEGKTEGLQLERE